MEIHPAQAGEGGGGISDLTRRERKQIHRNKVGMCLYVQKAYKPIFIFYRLFIYENVPQLKYHNSDVKFTVQRHRVTASTIRFKLGEASHHTLPCLIPRPSSEWIRE